MIFAHKKHLLAANLHGDRDFLKGVFDFLKYIVVYPVVSSKLTDKKGNVLPDAFLLPPGSAALDLATEVHRDLAEGFVRAIDVKTKKTIGKDHKLKDGDVVEIISSK